MTEARTERADAVTKASASIALVIALNKPIYPLYVWWLAGDALRASLLTVAAMPFYASLVFLAGRSSLAARIGLVVVGTTDTLAITKYLGEATGAWLFLAPCLMLAAMSFTKSEIWISRTLIAVIFCLAVGLLGHYGPALASVSPSDAATLFKLNMAGAFSLLAFIGLRFPLSSGE